MDFSLQQQQWQKDYQREKDFAQAQLDFAQEAQAAAKAHFCAMQAAGADQATLADIFAQVEAWDAHISYWQESSAFWGSLLA